MAITKSEARQWPLGEVVRFELADLPAGEDVDLASLLPGEIVVGGSIVIETAFDSGSSDTIIVGDEDDDDRYITGLDAQATGRTGFTLTGHKYTASNTLRIKRTQAGAAAGAGEGHVEFTVLREGRQTENV
jgi:hypothetical protein